MYPTTKLKFIKNYFMSPIIIKQGNYSIEIKSPDKPLYKKGDINNIKISLADKFISEGYAVLVEENIHV